MLAACAPIVGTAIFSAYLHVRFHDALAWVHGQAAWGAPLLGRPPAPDPTRLPGEPSVKVTEVFVYLGDIAAFVLAAAAIRPVTRRFGGAYGVWIAANIFPPAVAHLFISLGRFTSLLFPVFFWLAIRLPALWQVAWFRRRTGAARRVVLPLATRSVTASYDSVLSASGVKGSNSSRRPS